MLFLFYAYEIFLWKLLSRKSSSRLIFSQTQRENDFLVSSTHKARIFSSFVSLAQKIISVYLNFCSFISNISWGRKCFRPAWMAEKSSTDFCSKHVFDSEWKYNVFRKCLSGEFAKCVNHYSRKAQVQCLHQTWAFSGSVFHVRGGRGWRSW